MRGYQREDGNRTKCILFGQTIRAQGNDMDMYIPGAEP